MLPDSAGILRDVHFWEVPFSLMLYPGWLLSNLYNRRMLALVDWALLIVCLDAQVLLLLYYNLSCFTQSAISGETICSFFFFFFFFFITLKPRVE